MRRVRLHASVTVAVLCAGSLLGRVSWANPTSGENADIHGSAVSAIHKGAYTEAIQKFELLADRGMVHPDLSFNRGIAYAHRARSPQARPGDFGRAACALSETLALRPSDDEARTLLSRIDQELSRARSRRGNPSLLARPRLTRAVVGLLPENVWAISAMLSSAATTVGLLYRLGSERPRRRLAGAIALWLGAALLALSSAGLFYAMHARQTTRQGVVVSTDARLLDVTGAPLPMAAHPGQDLTVPEGARLVVTGRTERLLKVEWGNLDAYVSPSDVQLIAEVK